MTPDEIKKLLQEAGVSPGSWTQGAGEREIRSPIIEKQKKLLGELAGLLEQQIEQDKQLVASLHIKVQKLKQGGAA